jgi:hypothetical protein
VPLTAPADSAPVSGAAPPRDATRVRNLGTLTPAPAAVRVWQIVLGVLAAGLLAAVLVVRLARQRRRAELHARYNRMRVDRGKPPLTPKQIDFIGSRH